MKKVVLLDLGNVVLGIDFRRVFASWAKSAQIDEQIFHDRWRLDSFYKQHEVGEINFAEYAASLSDLFQVTLTEAQWRKGWNDLWTSPFAQVVELLPRIANAYELFAFTNTNQTHAEHFTSHYPEALENFSHIFFSSKIGHRKPDPTAYEFVCREMKRPPQQVVFLDDTLENIAGALHVGMDARHVDSEANVAQQLRTLLAHV